jgi:DNA-binding beta-propeller fold protein YncE
MKFVILLALAAVAAAQPQPDLVVVEKKASSVGFYQQGRRTGGVTVGQTPHEIVFSPDRRSLYVTNNGILWMTDTGEGGNTISIIDVASRRQTGTIDLGANRRPHGMDVIPKSGHLLVTVENPSGLLLVDPVARKVLRRYDTGGTKPHMVILDRQAEWAYVSNSGSGTVGALHLTTGKVKVIPVGENPQGGVFTRNGDILYLTVSIGNAIVLIDTGKQAVVGRIATGQGPGRVALTPDEKTLVYNMQLGERLGFADVATRKQLKEVVLPGHPLSLNLSHDGRLAYLGIQDMDKIVIASVPKREIVQVFDTPKGAGPDPVLELR